MMKKINIGIIGFGTVGTGVVKILLEQKKLFENRVGVQIIIKRIADLDIQTSREIKIDNEILTVDAKKVINDPEIDIIVELMGGETVAHELIMQAISNGKHIVTGNKALLAKHGTYIFEAASQKRVDIGFDASVGGCMPIIKTLRESLAGNTIRSIKGILNGTCNYILSKITNEGLPFDMVLKDAQKKGIAEADPTLDIGGFDTAHKLALLTSIAYGMKINLKDIYIEGITNITCDDIEFARQFGYRIKLLAISKNMGNVIESRVHPTMIPTDNLLSNVNDSLNAVNINGDAAGDILLYGHGAGMMPTASAVVSDIVDIARNIISTSHDRVPQLSYLPEKIKIIPVLPITEISTNYYIRFSAIDQPGVLSSISGILGNHKISIKSVHQKRQNKNGCVPIVMLTHFAKEADMLKALDEISNLNVIDTTPVIIRIENE